MADEYSEAWKYLERLPDELKQAARNAVKKVTYKKAKEVERIISDNTPRIDRWQPTADSGLWPVNDLKYHLTINPVDGMSRLSAEVIGYEVVFDGYYTYHSNSGKRQGTSGVRQVAYQKIANSLNAGFFIASNIPNWNGKYVTSCRGFIDKALYKLVNMDEEITKQFNQECRSITI